jgi:phosphomannomutase
MSRASCAVRCALCAVRYALCVMCVLLSTPVYSQEDSDSHIRPEYEKRTIKGITFVLPDEVRVYDKGGVMVRESGYEYTFRKFSEANAKLEELQNKYESLEKRVSRLESGESNDR